MKDTPTILADLWSVLGLPADGLEYVTLTGRDPALPTQSGKCVWGEISVCAWICVMLQWSFAVSATHGSRANLRLICGTILLARTAAQMDAGCVFTPTFLTIGSAS